MRPPMDGCLLTQSRLIFNATIRYNQKCFVQLHKRLTILIILNVSSLFVLC